MDKLLVTRVDTLVGANLAPTLSNRMEVVEERFVEPSGGPSIDGACEAIRRERPRLVVHAGPLSIGAWDAAGLGAPTAVRRLELLNEADVVRALAGTCREAGAKLVVVSTDALFDGPRMFHQEQSPPSARRAFGKAAATIEAALDAADVLVVRTHAYGWSPTSYGVNYAERMFRELTTERPCSVDAVRHATPILATDLAECVYAAYRADLRGVYHVAGAERTSPYRFAAELAAMLGMPGRYVNLTSRAAASRRPYVDETSLNTLAFRRAVERPLPMLREGLARFAAQAFDGYRARIGASSPESIDAPALVPQAA